MSITKPKSAWSNAHITLKRLYDERIGDGMSQKEFGRRYRIGSQSMVAQYLNGDKPLNYDAAAKFAKALDCTIYDICPEMGDALKLEIFPVLGKALRRAAMFLLCVLLQQFAPSDALAMSTSHNVNPGFFYSKLLNSIHIVYYWLLQLLTRSQVTQIRLFA